MSRLEKCKKYIADKTGCNPEDLKLKTVHEDTDFTQFKLVNAYALLCKYNKNFAEFYNF